MATVNKKNEGKKMTNNSLKNEDFILLGQTDSVQNNDPHVSYYNNVKRI